MSETLNSLILRSGAWDGDDEIALPVPATWHIDDLCVRPIPEGAVPSLRAALRSPIGTAPLQDLARGKKEIAVIVDDLTRPTPASAILPDLLDELAGGGITDSQISLFVSTGSHAPPTPDDIRNKVGPALSRFRRVVVHDCHGPCRDLGSTRRGTPVHVNARLMECDLKIGIGSVFPHPAAGFSGGPKIIAPGMCGATTIRFMHDHLRGARSRGGSLAHAFREEMTEVSARVGLTFSVSCILSSARTIAGCVAGAPDAALAEAVRISTPFSRVRIPAFPDLVVIDAYPFDSTLQFAHDRAVWPVPLFPPDIPVVLIARCARGKGTHEFFPAANPFGERVLRRIRQARLSDVMRTREIVHNAWTLMQERRREIILFSPHVSQKDVAMVFPRHALCSSWSEVCALTEKRLPRSAIHVSLFRTSPLLLGPEDQRNSSAKVNR